MRWCEVGGGGRCVATLTLCLVISVQRSRVDVALGHKVEDEDNRSERVDLHPKREHPVIRRVARQHARREVAGHNA